MTTEDLERTSADASAVGSSELARILRKAVRTMQLGVTVTDPAGRVVFVNAAAARMHGYDVAELIGHDLSRLAGPDAERSLSPADKQSIKRWSRESVNRRRDGTLFPVKLLSDVVTDSLGRPMGIITTIEDVSLRKEAEAQLLAAREELESKVEERTRALVEANQALRLSEARYRLLFERNLAAVYRTDLDGRILECNESFSRLVGLAACADAVGRSAKDFLDDRSDHGSFFERLARAGALSDVELRLVRADGTPVWILANATLVSETAGAPPAAVLHTCVDITQRKKAEEQLVHDALHDALTGLPNRTLFLDRLTHVISRSRRQGKRFAVLFIDLDRFKLVNDSLGHAAGDRVLVTIASRLKTCVRDIDTLARFGGDEFTLLLEDLEGVVDATRAAVRVQEELARAFVLDGKELFASASIGIAIGEGGQAPEDLLRDADTAMYRAKLLGKARYEIFDEGMRARAIALFETETDLRHALERRELVVHYQPIVALADGALVGVEALLRWAHPRRGLLSPAEFVPLAEETGLIAPIGGWVLDEACAALRRWRVAHPEAATLGMSVNISGRQLATAELPPLVESSLERHGIPPEALTIEITESSLLEHGEAAARLLGRIRALGVGLSLDDFGTGYSSLSYLHRLPLTKLKIDRSFVERIEDDPKRSRIVQAIVDLARALDLEVIAEGVETSGQAARLVEIRCARGQGFHYSRAVPEDAIGAMLAGGRVRLPA